MKLIKGKKQPSYQDKLLDGSNMYACPKCRAKGKAHASTSLTVTFSCLVERDGRIELNKPGIEAHCYHCKELIGVVVGSCSLKVDKIR